MEKKKRKLRRTCVRCGLLDDAEHMRNSKTFGGWVCKNRLECNNRLEKKGKFKW